MPVTAQAPSGPGPARLTPAAWLTLILLGAMTVAALVDVAMPDGAALLPMVVAPIVAAVLLPPRATAAISALSVLLALVLPGSFWSSSGTQYVRFVAVAGLGILAAVAAALRERMVSARLRLERERGKAEQARRHALEVNDSVYQDLFAARMWTSMGEQDRAQRALDRALKGAAQVVVDLVDELPVQPGSLVRRPREDPTGGPPGPAPGPRRPVPLPTQRIF